MNDSVTHSLPCTLTGQQVLVTRPRAQAEVLCDLIRAAGGEPILFPTVEIQPPHDAEAARAALAQSWDILIFVSRNAVKQALELSPSGQLPAGQTAAVGAATAAALTEIGRAPNLVPNQHFDSEGLLALPDLQQVRGQRILIVRGEGGRGLLNETLRQRGATVAYAEVYRRALPQLDAAPLMTTWRPTLNLLTATSNEVLNNLYQLIPDEHRGWFLNLPLAVFSERGAATAMQLGFRTVAVARESSDPALLDALCRLLFQQQHDSR